MPSEKYVFTPSGRSLLCTVHNSTFQIKDAALGCYYCRKERAKQESKAAPAPAKHPAGDAGIEFDIPGYVSLPHSTNPETEEGNK
jgi:hypothetical protein